RPRAGECLQRTPAALAPGIRRAPCAGARCGVAFSADAPVRLAEARSERAGAAERPAGLFQAPALSPVGGFRERVRFVTSIDIFTDGACSGNPGPGGWGAILRTGEHEKELSGGDRATSNNRMELTAVIRALEALKRSSAVTIHTDSRYVMDGVTQWMPRWKKNGWKTADKKPVKNEDLWRELDTQCARHELKWRWVRGHSGHPENERADALARGAIPG